MIIISVPTKATCLFIMFAHLLFPLKFTVCNLPAGKGGVGRGRGGHGNENSQNIKE